MDGALALRMGPDRLVPLGRGRRLGRAGKCDLQLTHTSVSREHCAIEVEHDLVKGERVWVRDLGSRLGTRVNGHLVEGRVELRAGDELQLGKVIVGRLTRVSPVLARDLDPTGVFEAVSVDRVDRLQALLEVGRLLGRPMALDLLLDQVVALARRVFDASHAGVLLVGDDGGLHAVGNDSYSRTIAEWVLRTGQAAVFADAEADVRSAGSDSVVALEIRSCMAVPLVPRDCPVGVLYLDHRAEPYRFGPDDLAFLGAFANQVAVAVENAWLRRDLEMEAAARSTLQRFFPPAALPALLASGGQFEPIEAEVTSLFCDIVDYTGIAARIGPRAVMALLNRYFGAVSTVVFDRGGTLEKYVGDAVLAVWGAPIPCEDHRDRAVGAALAIQAAMAALDPPIEVHIGLNTGVVAAGNVGTPTYLQYASFGDATNIASRVSGLAAAGEVVVTEAVWSGLSDPFPAEPEVVTVKGKPEPLTVYRWKGR